MIFVLMSPHEVIVVITYVAFVCHAMPSLESKFLTSRLVFYLFPMQKISMAGLKRKNSNVYFHRNGMTEVSLEQVNFTSLQLLS